MKTWGSGGIAPFIKCTAQKFWRYRAIVLSLILKGKNCNFIGIWIYFNAIYVRPISCMLTKHVVPLPYERTFVERAKLYRFSNRTGRAAASRNSNIASRHYYRVVRDINTNKQIKTNVIWWDNFKKLEIITLRFCEHTRTKRTESKWLNWSPHKFPSEKKLWWQCHTEVTQIWNSSELGLYECSYPLKQKSVKWELHIL